MDGPFKYESKPYIFALGGMTPEIPGKADRKLVAWWKFDESSGDTAADSSGNDHGGILVGEPQWQPSGGRFGGALRFDGSNHVEIPTLDMTTGTVTFVAWIRGCGVTEMSGIVYSRNLPGGLVGVGINCGPGDTLHYSWNRNARKTYTWDEGPKMPRDKWAMVAMAIEPTKATAYVYTDTNGLEQSANELRHISQNINALKIGWDSWATDRHFKGLIDDVRIYNYALSQAEIAAIYSGKEPATTAQAEIPTAVEEEPKTSRN